MSSNALIGQVFKSSSALPKAVDFAFSLAAELINPDRPPSTGAPSVSGTLGSATGKLINASISSANSSLQSSLPKPTSIFPAASILTMKPVFSTPAAFSSNFQHLSRDRVYVDIAFRMVANKPVHEKEKQHVQQLLADILKCPQCGEKMMSFGAQKLCFKCAKSASPTAIREVDK